MQLYYWGEQRNFGDALNPWLFPRLVPELLEAPDDTLFLGIGTVLGHEFPASRSKVVFSSGYAVDAEDHYGPCPQLDATWEIVCVRGPLTAEALGLDPTAAVTDGAALLRFVDLPEAGPRTPAVFMPHLDSLAHYDWAPLCAEAGLTYVDPRRPVDEVLPLLRAADVVLAEAMHAAIVADTLRVPWIPVRAYPSINAFKWRDWTRSLELPYEPTTLPALYGQGGEFVVTSRRLVPRPLRRFDRSMRRRAQKRRAVRALRSALRGHRWLSRDTVFEARTDELLTRLRRTARRHGANPLTG